MRHEDDEVHEVDLTRSLARIPATFDYNHPIPFSNKEIHSEALEAELMQTD